MEIKHKECFCPAFIDNYDMQGAATAARDVWEFVNLYSKTRGVNRFLAAIRSVELLSSRTDVRSRGISMPSVEGLREWTQRESKLGQGPLEAEVQANPHPDLVRALAWSRDVTHAVKKIVRNLPPFPQVQNVIDKAHSKADLMVVSQTPTIDLEREWAEHGIDTFVRAIAGQEMGSKAEHLKYAAGGKYDRSKVLMIGDAPGDLASAQSIDALFFPIIPGNEEGSWTKLMNEGLDRFFGGDFAGDYQTQLLDEFEAALPEHPPWKAAVS
jgi:phosphoglycolate phosphatase-like HAD superfamily hydrolase